MAPVGPWDLVSGVLSSSFPGRPADRLVVLTLLKAGDGCTGANAKISLTGISRKTGLKRDTVVACIRRLKALGLVLCELDPYKTTVYTVQVTALLDQSPNPTSPQNQLVTDSNHSSPKRGLGWSKRGTGVVQKGDTTVLSRASSVPLSVEKVRRPAGTRPEEQQHE